MRVLVTRPLPDGERTAEALRARGHEPVLMPLLRIEPVAAEIADKPYAAVLFTSANAPRALSHHSQRGALLALPAYAVGRASAAAARSAGFTQVLSADGDASDLVRLVAGQHAGPSAPLLYLAGEDRAGDLSAALAQQGLQADTVVIYRAVALPFPDDAKQALDAGSIDAVLHFSRRSASLYVEGAAAAGIAAAALRPKHYCFAAQTAEVLAAAGANQVAVAPKPQEQALLSLIV